jgi:hypothetical protein
VEISEAMSLSTHKLTAVFVALLALACAAGAWGQERSKVPTLEHLKSNAVEITID